VFGVLREEEFVLMAVIGQGLIQMPSLATRGKSGELGCFECLQ